MVDPLAGRRAERTRLLGLARVYVERAGRRMPLVAAAVVGSVARGDFNVWSDVDVVLVAEGLAEHAVERQGSLLEGAPPGVQPVGFTPPEFRAALAKGNPLAVEAVERGVPLVGERFFVECGALLSGRARRSPRS